MDPDGFIPPCFRALNRQGDGPHALFHHFPAIFTRWPRFYYARAHKNWWTCRELRPGHALHQHRYHYRLRLKSGNFTSGTTGRKVFLAPPPSGSVNPWLKSQQKYQGVNLRGYRDASKGGFDNRVSFCKYVSSCCLVTFLRGQVTTLG